MAHMQIVVLDGFQLEHNTAKSLTTLCKLRGVDAVVVYNEEKKQYIAGETPCGSSVHGVYEWLEKQHGVKP
jgi:hypothetical protein